MGRQVAVAMHSEDETQFLGFLRTSTAIRIFRSSAPASKELEVTGADLGTGRQYFIWNTKFAWRPDFKQVPQDAPVVERRGWFYLSNASTAPTLEYDRHGFEESPAQGRLYWAKRFSAPDDLAYDVPAFEAWYESVVRWVRKNGHRIQSESYGPYYLPVALARRRAA